MGRTNYSRAAILMETLQKPIYRYDTIETTSATVTDQFPDEKKGSRTNYSFIKIISVDFGVSEDELILLVVAGDGTVYIIKYSDPDGLFGGKIDTDNLDYCANAIEKLFTERRPNRSSDEYDTLVTIEPVADLGSAGTGTYTQADYETVDGEFVYSGFVGQINVQVKADMNGTSRDGVLGWPGKNKNPGWVLMVHEMLHGFGYGTLSGNNLNGQLLIDELPDGNVWSGSNCLTEYKALYPDLASDIEGVPFEPGQRAHFYNGENGYNRAGTLTINGKSYKGLFMDLLTTDGGEFLTRPLAAFFKDFGLPIDVDKAETIDTPTVPKTWAFDVTVGSGGGFELTANTSVYNNTYSTTTITGENPTIQFEAGDVVVLNIQTAPTSVNVYSTSSVFSGWSDYIGGQSSGTITLAPQGASLASWVFEDLRYSEVGNPSNYGSLNVVKLNSGWSTGDNKDPSKDVFEVSTGKHTWNSGSANCYTQNTASTSITQFPMYKGTISSSAPASGFTASDGEPWALAAAVKLKRRAIMWEDESDSGMFLISQSNVSATSNIFAPGDIGDGVLSLSIHENKSAGNVYARFRVGTSTDGVELVSSNLSYNHWWTGLYVDYDGHEGFRMFTHDFKSNTTTQATVSQYGSSNWNGYLRNVDFKIGKNHTDSSFWHGDIGHVMVTTLRNGVALPTSAEIYSVIRTPSDWLTTYKVGNSFRLPGETSDASETITPTSLGAMDTVSGGNYYRIGGTLILTQGSSSESPGSVDLDVNRGTYYEFSTSSQTLSSKDIKLSTSSPYHEGLAAADANVITENVTYTGTPGQSGAKITFGFDNDTPDYVYVYDANNTNPSSVRPYDGPLKVNGTGTLSGSSSGSVTFTVQNLGDTLTSVRQKSSQATKLWFFDGLILNDDSNYVKFYNQVAYEDTGNFVIKSP